jgi:hypothetical protein
MTWRRASIYIAVAFVFDTIRFIFEQFWFFAPLLIGFGIANWVLWGGAGSVLIATVVGGVVTYFAAPVVIFIGLIFAAIFGFIGWLVLAVMLLVGNRRIFSYGAVDFVWFIGSFAGSIMPFIGGLPFLSGTLFVLFRKQIHEEKKLLKKWQAEENKRLAEQKAARQLEIQSAQAYLAAKANAEATDEEETEDAFNEDGGENDAFEEADYSAPMGDDFDSISAEGRLGAANDNEIPEEGRRVA